MAKDKASGISREGEALCAAVAAVVIAIVVAITMYNLKVLESTERESIAAIEAGLVQEVAPGIVYHTIWVLPKVEAVIEEGGVETVNE